MNNKPRNRWIAALFTLFATGLGHIYAGAPVRGLAFFAAEIFLLIFYGICVVLFPGLFLMVVSLAGIIALIVFCVFDSFSIAKEKKEIYEPVKYNRWFVYLGYFIFAQFVTLPLSASFALPYKVTDDSMSPVLLKGDIVLADRAVYGKYPSAFHQPARKPRTGEVIVLIYRRHSYQLMYYFKRVTGVAGDEIQIADKKIFINGAQYDDPHAVFKDTGFVTHSPALWDNFGPETVPDNCFFVLNDQRDMGSDSRFLGYGDLDEVRGKVIMVLWSSDNFDRSIRWDRVVKLVE
jgi:signal peptidase I